MVIFGSCKIAEFDKLVKIVYRDAVHSDFVSIPFFEILWCVPWYQLIIFLISIVLFLITWLDFFIPYHMIIIPCSSCVISGQSHHSRGQSKRNLRGGSNRRICYVTHWVTGHYEHRWLIHFFLKVGILICMWLLHLICIIPD